MDKTCFERLGLGPAMLPSRRRAQQSDIPLRERILDGIVGSRKPMAGFL